MNIKDPTNSFKFAKLSKRLAFWMSFAHAQYLFSYVEMHFVGEIWKECKEQLKSTKCNKQVAKCVRSKKTTKSRYRKRYLKSGEGANSTHEKDSNYFFKIPMLQINFKIISKI